MLSINNTAINREGIYNSQIELAKIHPALGMNVIIDTSTLYREDLHDSTSQKIREYVSWAVVSIRHMDGRREILGIHTMDHPRIIISLMIFLDQMSPLVESRELDIVMKELGERSRAHN